ncbi:MAG: hypothetical protein RL113_665 [Pseudomonadota bacterium]
MTKKSLSLITATLLFTTHNYAEERLELISVISSALIETNEKEKTNT